MRIPANPADRLAFAQDLIEKCRTSMNDREAFYRAMRSYVIKGSDSGVPAHFNKIFPHLDALSSYLYAADSTRFTCHLGESVPKAELAKTQVFAQQLENDWEDSNTDILFSQAVFWALGCNSMFLKFGWYRGHQVKLILPEHVGVLREDVPGLSNQEAFVYKYQITKSELIDRLYQHPNAAQILSQISFTINQPQETTVMDRILLSASSPNVIGNAPLQANSFEDEYSPKVDEDTCTILELYVWNDETSDYQIMSFADPMIPIWDRPCEQVCLKGESGLVQVCPNPLPNYFWGMSEAAQLRFLQEMRNQRMGEILHMASKQARPPKIYAGFSGIPDERNDALDTPNGFFFSDNPSAKVQDLTPQIPADLFNIIDQIDMMFGEASGIGSILMGEGSPGVRSASQAAQLAKLGGSRAKKRAMIVEDALDKCATIMARINQKYNKEVLTTEAGEKFIAAQFTDDFTMRVDAHSNSPLFVDDSRALAFNMLKAGLITKARCIEMINPPMKQALLADLQQSQEHQFAQGEQPQQEAQPGQNPQAANPTPPAPLRRAK